MKFISWFIPFCLAWLVGIFAGAFLLGQVLILLFFSIPTTVKLNRFKIMTSYRPLFSDIISVVLLAGLFILTTWAFKRFFPQYVIGYYIGLGITGFSALGQCRSNQNNIQDYIQNNARYINKERLAQTYQTP